MSIRLLAIIACTIPAGLFVPLFVQAQEISLQATFQNSTNAAVDIYAVAMDGSETLIAEKLPAGKSVDLPVLGGNLFVVKVGEDILGEYQADDNAVQIIDLTELASWQLPVQLNFLNDSGMTVNIFLVDDKGDEIEYANKLKENEQHVQLGVPTKSRWLIKSDGKVVAEYIADNDPEQDVPLKELIDDFAQQVTVEFQNTTADSVDIYWRSPDGQEVLYAPELPAGMGHKQITFAEHIWIIRRKQEFVAMFVPGDVPAQVCDIKAVVEIVQSAPNKEGVKKPSKKPPRPAKPAGS